MSREAVVSAAWHIGVPVVLYTVLAISVAAALGVFIGLLLGK